MQNAMQNCRTKSLAPFQPPGSVMSFLAKLAADRVLPANSTFQGVKDYVQFSHWFGDAACGRFCDLTDICGNHYWSALLWDVC
jgi:hypothetical protein